MQPCASFLLDDFQSSVLSTSKCILNMQSRFPHEISQKAVANMASMSAVVNSFSVWRDAWTHNDVEACHDRPLGGGRSRPLPEPSLEELTRMLTAGAALWQQ